MKDFWSEEIKKKINIKKITGVAIIVLIVILLIILLSIYMLNQDFRNWIDKNILRKEVLQDSVTTIELKDGENNNIYAFNKYIGILNKNKFNIYGSNGNQIKELEVQVSNPIFNSSNRFLVIAENKGQKLYCISDKDILWEEMVDGNISQVHVNKNGYVAVVITDTSYKTVIVMYDSQGTRLFKTYLSSTRTVDVSISNDNKYLAIAEIDTSGTLIQSSVRIMSIEKATTDPTNSLVKTFKGEGDKLIVNVEYQEKNKLVCMYTDSIHVIENENDSELINNNSKKVLFEAIELSNTAISIEEQSSGLFTANSVINIIDINSKDTKKYTVDSVTKEIYTYGNMIALNLGTEVEIINTSAMLVKRYIANQEITKIVMSDNIAGIVYREKIEIINL